MTRAAWIAGLCVAGLATGQTQLFRSLTDAVRVDVLVTDGRQPIGGLTAADFELRDSGVLQTIEDLQITEVPFSVLLALDTSSSMEGRPLRDLQDAVTAATGALKIGDRAAILTFGESIGSLAPWGADTPALLSAVEGLEAAGATSLFDAALAALVFRDPEPGRRSLLILFTDGVDTASWLPDFAALDLGMRTDTVVYGVTIAAGHTLPVSLERRSGIRIDRGQPVISSADFLRELASRTGGERLSATTAGLGRVFQRIVDDFRSRYVLAYTPRGVAQTGWHPLEVKVKGRRAQVTARRGYQR